MKKLTTGDKESSSGVWDYLEELVRLRVREFIQTLLEDEVTELLRRGKSERREALDSPPVYRNGYGKGRKLTLGCGTITKVNYRGLCTRRIVMRLRPGERTSSVGAGSKAMTGPLERWSRTGSGW